MEKGRIPSFFSSWILRTLIFLFLFRCAKIRPQAVLFSHDWMVFLSVNDLTEWLLRNLSDLRQILLATSLSMTCAPPNDLTTLLLKTSAPWPT